MRVLGHLFENNRKWVEKTLAERPGFFEKLSNQQKPEILWIGCSDSRLSPNEILGLLPGELFVHRNVANLVIHTDINCLSVIEYAVFGLGIKHIIVCGHYGCGGVQAALRNSQMGLIDNWLRHIRDIHDHHRSELEGIPDEAKRWDRLCELNVLEQVHNVCNTTIVQAAWAQGRDLSIHGWIYRLKDGILRDLGLCVTRTDDVEAMYHKALASITGK